MNARLSGDVKPALIFSPHGDPDVLLIYCRLTSQLLIKLLVYDRTYIVRAQV